MKYLFMRCHLTFQGIAVVKLCSCRALGSSETRSNIHGRGTQHHVGWNTVVYRGLNHVGGASVCFIVSMPPSNESHSAAQCSPSVSACRRVWRTREGSRESRKTVELESVLAHTGIFLRGSIQMALHDRGQ